MYYNNLMNPVRAHLSTSHTSVMSLRFQRATAGASLVEGQTGATLYGGEANREGAGTMLRTFGIGTSPRQETTMWLTDGIGTSPCWENGISLADGIGTSPDHERN